MSFEEEFDSIIRRKSEELDFPFDEKNWDKASALLDAEHKIAAPKAGIKRFLIPSIIAGVIVVSGIAIVLSTSSHVVPTENKPAVAQAGTVPNTAIAAKQNVNEPTVEGSTTPSEKLNSNTSSSKTENTIAENAVSGKLNSNTSSSKTENITAENTAIATAQASEKNTDRIAPAYDANNAAVRTSKNTIAKNISKKDRPTVNVGTVENNNAPGTTPVAKDNTSSTNSAPSSDNKNKIAPETKTPVVSGDETTGITQAKGSSNENSVATTNVTPQSEPFSEPVQNAATTLNEQSLANQASENQNEAVQYLPLVFVSQPSQADPEIVEAPLNYINRYDEDYFNNGKKHKFHFANVEVGATYLLGWDTQAGKDGKGLDWFGGFNYGLYMTKKISVSAGIQAYNIKNITQAFYTNNKVNYDFGSVISNTTITSNNLTYLAVPVKVGYELNKTSQFNVGANFGYLIASKNTVETYQVLDNVKMHNKNVKNTNIYQNASSMNIMLSAAYKVEVMRRLKLNTEFVYGLSDIFKNTKTIKNNEQAIGIRVSLQYTLFDK